MVRRRGWVAEGAVLYEAGDGAKDDTALALVGK